MSDDTAKMTRDQWLILALVRGHVVPDKRGRPRTVYPKKGSALELEARSALARELRKSSPLDLGLRFILAEQIDPDGEDSRQILFEYRRKGNRSNAMAEKQVAEFIRARAQAGGMEAAFQNAIKHFGLKRARILEIWGHWQPILQKLKRN
jgi:hypothetical protein